MTDYYQRKHELQEAITLECGHLTLDQLRRVLRYVRTLSAEQPRLFDDTKKCPICGRVLIKPRRGPMPTYCSDKCRQKNYRRSRQAGA